MAFHAANDRVDTFLGTVLHGQKEYASLCKLCLCLFCHIAKVQLRGGFSVNENILVENLEYQSLIG